MTATVTTPAPPLRGSSISAGRKIKNGVAATLVVLAVLVALVPLVWLLWTVISNGYHALFTSTWFTTDARNLTYRDAGGGALHAIIGTLEQVALCSVISVPIALLTAVYLVEYGRGFFAKAVTFMLDILTGIPSIVAALFIYAVFIIGFGGVKAGWMVSLALVLLMIPVITRSSEEILRLVPNELREASFALGIPKWRTIMRVVFPTALSGIITGIVLGIARVAGETAPLLILLLYNPNTNSNLFQGPQGALPTYIYDQSTFFNTGGTYILGPNGKPMLTHNYAVDRLWGAALTLIIIVMLLNLIARLVGRSNKVAR
jgi:phosphate transport system permease protein